MNQQIHIRDAVARTHLADREVCSTCDGHRGEIDHHQRFWPCGDCGGLGWVRALDDMPGVSALLNKIAFGKASA